LDGYKYLIPYRKVVRRAAVHRNPLTNMRALMKLNPYSAVIKKNAAKVAAARLKQKEELLAKKRGVSLGRYKKCLFSTVSKITA